MSPYPQVSFFLFSLFFFVFSSCSEERQVVTSVEPYVVFDFSSDKPEQFLAVFVHAEDTSVPASLVVKKENPKTDDMHSLELYWESKSVCPVAEGLYSFLFSPLDSTLIQKGRYSFSFETDSGSKYVSSFNLDYIDSVATFSQEDARIVSGFKNREALFDKNGMLYYLGEKNEEKEKKSAFTRLCRISDNGRTVCLFPVEKHI